MLLRPWRCRSPCVGGDWGRWPCRGPRPDFRDFNWQSSWCCV